MANKIVNGAVWKDTDGNVISCHGGGFLQKDGYFYWFGENRHQDKLVSCYRSKDLVIWEFCNDVVTKNTHPDLNPSNCERPKVIYNDHTQKYVMWLHWENGVHYGEARCAVLECDVIDGDYIYLRSFRPEGHMSRDCTLFKEDDGTAYFISAANENADLHVYRLSDDYLDIAHLEKILWAGQKREAPALVKKGKYYFLVTSACTGWHPNQGKYAYSKSITGEWSKLIDIGSPTTFDTQPTYILPVHGQDQTTYLYIGDRWDPSDYHNSTYVFLPISFPTDTSMSLEWASSISIDVTSGRVTREVNDSKLYRITSNLQYLVPQDEKMSAGTPISFSRLAYANKHQLWELEYTDDTSLRIKHYLSDKYLAPENLSNEAEAKIVLANFNDHPSQEWIAIDTGEGYVKLQNKHSKMALTIRRKPNQYLVQTPFYEQWQGHWDEQAILLAKFYE